MKVILVNIYGGITKCGMIAQSIITDAEKLGPVKVPVVVRLKGTNSDLGNQMLQDYPVHLVSDFGQAAKLAVDLAHK